MLQFIVSWNWTSVHKKEESMLKCTLAYILTFPEQNISKAETRNWHESSAFAHRLQYILKKGYLQWLDDQQN